ncbi:thiopeptide maturation pyridine synthase [Plantactinospora sonchi]|uniref:Thiopeptide maturation pyridine synthase n=1 Tax=Plantactinospora sonchi TaxID=1544735 RepID=A0ABU7RMB9_9ACTN
MRRWHSLHIAYHDPDRDGLLLDAVRPALAGLGADGTDAYVLRHWRRGPHLRLNLRTDEVTWRKRIRPALVEAIGGYLRDHPSTTVVDQTAALERHRVLALQEYERGPLTPWYPDNSIVDAEYDSRRHVLGSDAAVEVLTDFYRDGNPLLFEMLDHVRSGGDRRDGVAMHLMLTAAHTAPGPLTSGFVAFRSHAEGFLGVCAHTGADQVRTAFDTAWRDRADEVVERVRGVVRALDDPAAPAVPFVREWADLLTRYRPRFAELVTDGTLAGPPPAPRRSPGIAHSELHRLMFDHESYRTRVLTRPDFLHYRAALNHTYLHLTRLGLAPMDRFRAGHLLANGVEAVYDVSALALVRNLVAEVP